MRPSYRSIRAAARAETKDRNSRFFAHAIPCDSRDELKQHLHALREKYPDANHVCHAYRFLLPGRIDEFSSDDGEPSGSSGLPILNTIRRKDLLNIAVFVARIFGGTKLGIPGLIRAYGGAAEQALLAAEIYENRPKILLGFEYNYSQTPVIDAILNAGEYKIVHQEFAESVQIVLEMAAESEAKFESILQEKSAAKIKISSREEI